MKFEKVNPKQDFFEIQTNILDFWKKNKTFEKSINSRPESAPYRFYDGPPFITGTPHYGSLLSSICKDVVPRFWTMKGKRVERIWGWDCHGLPIEEKVQKKLGLESSRDIEKVGVETFIKECYKYTSETSAEWLWYVDNIGRWVDMENAYKTMDQDYMESTMNVFSELYKKGLIYKGQRVSLYSWKLSTPISNFEVAMDDSYKEVSDPAITVKFQITNSSAESKKLLEKDFGEKINKFYLLAWTTTPWTIPAHMAIGVNKELLYSVVLCEENAYILASGRIETVFKGKDYKILQELSGEELVGVKYLPPFDYYIGKISEANNFKVYNAEFVTDTDGTGIAHEAPEFGDVDFQLAKANGINITNALDEEGKYTSEIFDLKGTHFQTANDIVSERLKEKGLLFKKESINHRVAMDPRTGTPLIYKAQDSWFIDIAKLKPKLISENEGINWFPEHLKHGQFLKSMESAPDWAISRTRYWGTPMPIWLGKDKDGNQVDLKVLGSRQEILETSKMLEFKDGKYYFTAGKYSGQELNLHKPYIDEIIWEENGITYTRIPEVLDVWMDSGSMPYSQMHYPFENKSEMLASYPADFIVEYIGQVRAWFYVMHVVGVALFDKRSFTNVITTGIVYGSDGRKMSKSYGNYPDPKTTIQKYSGDAVRFYMINSPLLSGNNMSFKDEGLAEVIKKVILPLWNTYYFFTTYANIDEFETTGNETRNNPLDIWIISEIHTLINSVNENMEKYRLAEAARSIEEFMDRLTNWYIRRSRKRFWKSGNDSDKMQAYETLYAVLVELTKVIAPFMPFVSEYIFKNLTGKESVHLEYFTEANLNLVDEKLNKEMDLCQKIITLGLGLRSKHKIRVRQPLQSISLGFELSDYYGEIIREELNVKEIKFVNPESIATKVAMPNGKLIGPKFGKDVKIILSEAKSGNFKELENGQIEVAGFILEKEDYEIAFKTSAGVNEDSIESGFGMVITMDLNISEELKVEGIARDLVRHIQELRKKANYEVSDRIFVNISSENKIVKNALQNFAEYISTETLSEIKENLENFDLEEEIELEEINVKIKVGK